MPVSGAKSYDVYNNDLLTANTSETVYSEEGLALGAECSFFVRAKNDKTVSTNSNAVIGTYDMKSESRYSGTFCSGQESIGWTLGFDNVPADVPENVPYVLYTSSINAHGGINLIPGDEYRPAGDTKLIPVFVAASIIYPANGDTIDPEIFESEDLTVTLSANIALNNVMLAWAMTDITDNELLFAKQYFTGSEFSIDRSHFYSGHKYRISIHAPFGEPPELVCESEFSIAATGIDPLRYSGVHWCSKYQELGTGDEKINYLVDYFQQPIRDFLADLRGKGYRVRVTSALRPRERAYLMHYAWDIEKNNLTPQEADSDENKTEEEKRPVGVDIIWTHPEPDSLVKSKTAAREMFNRYGLMDEPSFNSRHFTGKAVDISVDAGPSGEPQSEDERLALYREVGSIGTSEPHNLQWRGMIDEVHWFTY